MMEGYLTTLDQAEEFFRRCSELKEDTLENRMAILKAMALERRAFHQSEEQIKKRVKNKKVLVVKEKVDKPSSN